MVLLILRLFIHPRINRSVIEPTVTLIVPAHNEEKVIATKIHNIASLDYPRDKLELLIASDGSTDCTVEVAHAASDGDRIRVLAFTRNRGKISVLNDAVRQARGEVVVFSDAAALLRPDSIRHIIANFADPRVGAVSGKYQVHGTSQARMGAQEKFYWQYETFVKVQESAISSVLGGHGQLLAVRRELYPYPPDGTINDDYVIPVGIIASGYRVIYESQAIAEEEATEMSGFQRRVRIVAGNVQQMRELKKLLWPLRALPLFFFVSHKVTRLIVPFFMLSLAAANLFLLGRSFYRITALCQIGFYGLALLGCRWKLNPRALRLPYYFCFVNAACLWCVLRYSFGIGKVSWE